MTDTIQKVDEIDFLTYCRLTVNVYPAVRRFGFNPTLKIWESKIELQNAA